MSLIDLIKKKPVIPTPVSPKTPDLSDAAKGPEQIDTSKIPPSQVQQPVARVAQMADHSGLSTMSENPVPSVIDRMDNGQDVYEALLQKNYQDSEENLRGRQKAALLGDLAKVFGQSVALGIGARQFQPIQSTADKYSDALTNLKLNYNKDRMNYTLSKAKSDRDAEIYQSKLQMEFERDKALAGIKAALDSGLIDQRHANELEAQARKAKDSQELAKVNNEASMRRAQYNANQAMERTNKNNQTRLDIAGKNGKSGTGKGSEESIRLANPDGTYEVLRLSKDDVSAVNSLYGRMQDLAQQDAKNGKSDRLNMMDQLRLEFGENVDQKTTNYNVVARLMQYFPELNEELKDIIKSNQPQPAKKTITGFDNSGNQKKKVNGF